MEPFDSDKHLNLTTVPRSDVNPMMPAASWVVSGGLSDTRRRTDQWNLVAHE
jgi:hypothetical protein